MVDGVLLDSSSPSVSIRGNGDKIKFVFVSPVFLESWTHDNPMSQGIGGSETSHIELVKLLTAWGHEVFSYVPLPNDVDETFYIRDVRKFDIKNHQNSVVVLYRDPKFFNQELDPTNKYWYLSQDVDSPGWTEDGLKRIDRFIVLCPVHGAYIAGKYPSIKEKITYSSNGIRSDQIRHIKTLIKNEKIKRDTNRIIYTSSPDRGVELILENWFRILEQHPKANFHWYYGFDNIDKILAVDPNNKLKYLRIKLLELSKQPNVYFHGRVAQDRLYHAIAQSSIWFYPSDWPETSCITGMEMQALGTVPVVTSFWANKQNILHGYKFENLPQNSPITKIRMIDTVINLLKNPPTEQFRKEMSKDALDTFCWSKFAKQFQSLAIKDLYAS